jgi:carboxyl-terminal processing protease
MRYPLPLLAIPFLLLVSHPSHATTVPWAPDAMDAEAAREVDRIFSEPGLAYSGRTQDNQFLTGVVDRYIDTLDPSHMIFLSADEQKFKTDPRWVRAALQGRALAAPLRIFEIFRTRLDEAASLSSAQAISPHAAYPTSVTWQLDRSGASRAKTHQEWVDNWEKSVQNDRLELLQAGHAKDKINKDLAERYKETETIVDRMTKDQVLDLFLDAYTRSFDPHSNYFPPQEADDFAMAMGLSVEGIGASLTRQHGLISVEEVIHGSPAEAAGISVGDQLSAVGPSAQDMHSVENLPLPDVIRLIRGSKGTPVTLEIRRKSTGKLERLAVVRDVIQMEAQKVKTKFIKHSGQPVIAVISLPLFYHDFRADPGKGNSAAADVEKALQASIKEGASAVVLDISGNGGGSLMEAVNLVGLFLPPGPVVQVRNASGGVEVIESDRKYPVWTGPLALVVDSSSASASELVAAALQDRGRALIVGERSFGKGTVQTMVDLDHLAGRPTPAVGQVKLTTAQFFRPSGVSTQLVGVVPDVILSTSPTPEGERSYKNALPAASVSKAPAPTTAPFFNKQQLKYLATKSRSRVGTSIHPAPPTTVALNPIARQKQDKARDVANKSSASKGLAKTEWASEAAHILSDFLSAFTK